MRSYLGRKSAAGGFNKQLDELDSGFYGESYKSGSGRMSDVGEEAMARRMQLAEAIDTMSAGYVSKGKEVPPLETLIEDAHKITFKDRVSEVASKSKKGRLKKQASRRQSWVARHPSRQSPLAIQRKTKSYESCVRRKTPTTTCWKKTAHGNEQRGKCCRGTVQRWALTGSPTATKLQPRGKSYVCGTYP